MLTWFKKIDGRLLEPETMSPAEAKKSAETRAHRGLDNGLRKAFASPKLMPAHNSKAFMQRLEKALAQTQPSVGIGDKISAYLGQFADAMRANSYAVPRFASLVIIPVLGFVIYSSMNRPGPEGTVSEVAVLEQPGLRHEEMAPDDHPEMQSKDDAPSADARLASGFPKPTARSMKAEAEFDQVAQETLAIQEDLLKKNLEMAPNAAAKKSALEQLLDFYKKSGMKEKAQSTQRELEKQPR